MLLSACIASPLGTIAITGTDKGIESVSLLDEALEASKNIPAPLQTCAEQLNDYFNGSLNSFSLQLNPQGTAFQHNVWKALQQIPFGKTYSYMDIAKQLGDVKAIRAVGLANGRNPIAIIIPCHRVIGSNGDLTGYAGGLWRKKWLLEHELAIPKDTQQSLF